MTAPYQPGPLPRFQPQAPTPAPKPSGAAKLMKRLGMAAAFVVTFVFGVSVGNVDDTPATQATSSAPRSTYSAPAPTYSIPTYEAPAAQAPAPAVEAEQPAPADTITNGTYEIGTEVAPGKYKSPGPESGVIQLCYVDVKQGEKYLAQEVSNDGQVRVEIKSSWNGALMKVSGCQPLVKQ